MILKASVIIPSYNRSALLKMALDTLAGQSLPAEEFEVVIVDDGSTDDTAQMIKNYGRGLNLKYIYQPKSGLAKAKNKGINGASADILIFMDSDLMADREFIRSHCGAHGCGDNIMVAGRVILVNDFSEVGKRKESIWDMSRNYFPGGNSSIRKSVIAGIGSFDEDFEVYGWEDLELGLRLRRKGIKSLYCAAAAGYHLKRIFTPETVSHFCETEKLRAQTAWQYLRKHNTLEVKMQTQIHPFYFALDSVIAYCGWLDLEGKRGIMDYLWQKKYKGLFNVYARLVILHSYMSSLKEHSPAGKEAV